MQRASAESSSNLRVWSPLQKPRLPLDLQLYLLHIPSYEIESWLMRMAGIETDWLSYPSHLVTCSMLGGGEVRRSPVGWPVSCALAGSSPSPAGHVAERWQELPLPHAPQPAEERGELSNGFWSCFVLFFFNLCLLFNCPCLGVKEEGVWPLPCR